jgi:uncharacterized protein YcaQ
MEIPTGVARRFAVWKQCFGSAQNSERILETIRKLGCIQIDTINVVERSHYTVLWSRIGNYEKKGLDRLLHPERKVFEFWAHAASIIPMEHYRYFIQAMKENRKGLADRAARRLTGKVNLLGTVLCEIHKNGPMSSRDFVQEEKVTGWGKGSGWWSWKPAKIALEILFNAGVLMVAHRENFQRYYDLTENVLPSSVDTTEPNMEERRRFFVEKALSAAGIARLNDISNYYYPWCTHMALRGKEAEGTVEELLNDDILERATVRGFQEPYYILSEDCGILEKMAKDDLKCFDGVTFLSPFDNLIWFKDRTKNLFHYSSRLEAYLPGRKREYGYYNMNILYRDRLIGRLDPKVHRDQRILEIRSLHFEKNFKPTVIFREKFADAILSFMRFNEATEMRLGMVPRNIRASLSDMIHNLWDKDNKQFPPKIASN